MTTTAEQMRAWTGPAILTYGFRPFFFGAAIWAALAMTLWVPMLSGHLTLPTAFDPVSWHAHEFLFGYLGAVIAGFRHFDVDLVGAEQRCPASTTEPDQHTGLRQFSHRRLGNGGAGTQQYRCRVGDGDIPVQAALACIGHVFHPTTLDQHPTMLEVVEIGSFGMKDGLEIRGCKCVHGQSLLFHATRVARHGSTWQ